MSALLTVDFVVLALFAGFCVARVIPACSTSIFRFHLWQFRDQFADEIRTGVYEKPERARQLLQEVELTIEKAADVTAGRALFMQMFGRRLGSFPHDFPLDDLCERDRRRLQARCDWLDWALSRHIYFGSPLGWVLLLGLTLLSLIIAAVERPFKHGGSVIGDVKHRVRGEVDPRLTLIDGQLRSSGVSRQRQLSHMV
jgi:hypothetical protein